jgi:putative membrane protein
MTSRQTSLSLALAACAAAGVAGCTTSDTAAEVATAAARSPSSPIIAGDYVTMAAASDEYERQAGMLAASQGADARVKDFGRMMVQDHATSSAQVAAAARAAGIAPTPPMLRPDQQQMLTELRGLSGPTFDSAYLAQQVTAHKQALALHSTYAANGESAPLKAAAAKIVPVVQHHLDIAMTLQSSLGG